MTKNFKELAQDIGELVEHKNKSYGSAFEKAGDFLSVLYPNGIKPDQYKDMLCIVRVFDKLMRIATSYEGTEEKKIDAYSDLMGYALLGLRSSLSEQEKNSALTEKTTDNLIENETLKETEDQLSKIDPKLNKNRWAELAFGDKNKPAIGKDLIEATRQQETDQENSTQFAKLAFNTPIHNRPIEVSLEKKLPGVNWVTTETKTIPAVLRHDQETVTFNNKMDEVIDKKMLALKNKGTSKKIKNGKISKSNLDY